MAYAQVGDAGRDTASLECLSRVPCSELGCAAQVEPQLEAFVHGFWEVGLPLACPCCAACWLTWDPRMAGGAPRGPFGVRLPGARDGHVWAA